MASYFQLASGGASLYKCGSGNIYRPDPVTGIIRVPCPDPGRDTQELQQAGCRLLNVDAAQMYYRMVGAVDTQYTALPSGTTYATDDSGVTLVPNWLNPDAQSLLSQGLAISGMA
jgi:hypothetical protein